MDESQLASAMAIYAEIFPPEVLLGMDQRDRDTSMSWDIPQIGRTFDMSYRFTDCKLDDTNALGKNASLIMMLENSVIYNRKHRRAMGLQAANESDKEFWTRFGEQVKDLIRYKYILSNSSAAETVSFPQDPIIQGLMAVAALTTIVLKHIRMKLPPIIEGQIFEGIDWGEDDFGKSKARLSPIISHTLSVRASKYDPPVRADDYGRVLTLLTEQISTENDRSLYDQGKIRNVREAQEYILQKNAITSDDLLAIHRIVLDGLMDNTGIIRNGVIFAGGDLRQNQPVKPEDIMNEINILLSAINNLPTFTAQEDMYLFCAKIAAKFQLIHPFRDGNGRVGHVLTNYVLSRLGLPMFEVSIDDDEEYITAMDLAIGKGNFDALIKMFRGA